MDRRAKQALSAIMYTYFTHCCMSASLAEESLLCSSVSMAECEPQIFRKFFCFTGQLPKLITYARFSGSHKSNFLLLELCLFQLQSRPFECGRDQGSTVLTLSFLEYERRRDSVSGKKAEVPTSGNKVMEYFRTDKISIHYTLEQMKSRPISFNFLLPLQFYQSRVGLYPPMDSNLSLI